MKEITSDNVKQAICVAKAYTNNPSENSRITLMAQFVLDATQKIQEIIGHVETHRDLDECRCNPYWREIKETWNHPVEAQVDPTFKPEVVWAPDPSDCERGAALVLIQTLIDMSKKIEARTHPPKKGETIFISQSINGWFQMPKCMHWWNICAVTATDMPDGHFVMLVEDTDPEPFLKYPSNFQEALRALPKSDYCVGKIEDESYTLARQKKQMQKEGP